MPASAPARMASANRKVTPARRSTPSRSAGRESEVMEGKYTAPVRDQPSPGPALPKGGTWMRRRLLLALAPVAGYGALAAATGGPRGRRGGGATTMASTLMPLATTLGAGLGAFRTGRRALRARRRPLGLGLRSLG